jgi:hypothetical protein
VIKPASKSNLVGKIVPGVGVPLSVDGKLVRYGTVGVAVGVALGVIEGKAEEVAVGVGEGRVVGVGVGVAVCPEGVAVNDGNWLVPAARTTKERLTFLRKPRESVYETVIVCSPGARAVVGEYFH